MGISGGGILWSFLPHVWKCDSWKEVSELESKLICTNTPFQKHSHETPILQSASESFLLTSLPHHFPSFSDCHSHFMEGKYSFLCIECIFPPPEVHSLWTVFGWTLQSSLKREPFPTVLWKSSPFEVTAGWTKLISSIHNVSLMQCWLTLPLAGSRYWNRPKFNV